MLRVGLRRRLRDCARVVESPLRQKWPLRNTARMSATGWLLPRESVLNGQRCGGLRASYLRMRFRVYAVSAGLTMFLYQNALSVVIYAVKNVATGLGFVVYVQVSR